MRIYDYLLIAAESGSDPRTVRRAYAGARCLNTTHERICRAAADLKLPAPPPQQTDQTR